MKNGGRNGNFVTKAIISGVGVIVGIAGFASASLYVALAERISKVEQAEFNINAEVTKCNTRLQTITQRADIADQRAYQNERELRGREKRITTLEVLVNELEKKVKKR